MTDTMPEQNVTDTCDTFNSTGFHLDSLDWIKNTVLNMFKMYVNNPQNSTPFPSSFLCAHCNAFHVLTHEILTDALYRFPGAIDMVAMYNELQAMIHKTHPTDVGNGSENGFSVSTDTSLHDIATVDNETVPEDSNPQDIPTPIDEKETLSGTDSANIASPTADGSKSSK